MNDFTQEDFDSLRDWAKGKPMTMQSIAEYEIQKEILRRNRMTARAKGLVPRLRAMIESNIPRPEQPPEPQTISRQDQKSE